MPVHAVITGTGSYLPETIVSNNDLAKKMKTSDEWIRSRTGIQARHVAGPHETNNFMATKAAKQALDMAGLKPNDIDMIIVATVSGSYSFPATACFVQKELGMTNDAPAFDIQAACSGFIYGLHFADGQIRLGASKRILVIGAEKFSAYLNWDDRSTSVLFGDGAGAAVVEARHGAKGGVLSTCIHAEGALLDLLKSTGGPSTTKTTGFVEMNGREVYRHAVRRMAGVVEPMLEAENLSPSDITWLVPHQANLRIIESTAKYLGLPMERVIQTVGAHANTSAASVPLALDTANRQGQFKTGDLILLNAFGAGFTWAGALIRWA